MPATVTIRRWTGSSGSPTKTDITSINTRANAEDAHSTAGTTNPIQIPASGTNYSYKVSTRLSADTSPSGTINNIKWYSDGSNGFGTGVGCNVKTEAAYAQATGTPGTSGDEMTGGAAFTTYTSGSPLSVTGSVSNPSTGDFGDFVSYQITVGTTAGPGATGQETFTWVFDET